LRRALASVAGLADEIIVTDTGSTDGTLTVARELGARTAQFDWIDDFAAVHNFCKSLARGVWILMLDADEELLPESRAELLDCIEQDSVLAFMVIRQDLHDAARLDHLTEMWQMRLFRNRPDLSFVGRCHHHFSPSLGEIATRAGLELRESTIRLRHYGYLPEKRQQKLKRAAHLLQLELRQRPGQFYYLVELGLTQLALGDPTGHQQLVQAGQMVVENTDQARENVGQLAMLLEYCLANPQLPADFPLSRDTARSLADRHFPKSVPLVWHIAQEHYAAGRFAQCAQLLEQILELARTHNYDRSVSFDPSLLGDAARLNLAVCLVRMARLDEARDMFCALLDSPTHHKQAAENLREIDRLAKSHP